VLHTSLAESPDAVCLNGIGHDGDGPNAASPDASNHNFRTLMLVGHLIVEAMKVAQERVGQAAPRVSERG
jgi:hypothetical protein